MGISRNKREQQTCLLDWLATLDNFRFVLSWQGMRKLDWKRGMQKIQIEKDQGRWFLFVCWLTLGLCSTLTRRMRRKGRDVKNLKSTLLDEKINEVSTASLANAQDLRRGYLQVTQVTPLLCISTQNGSLMHCCETFTLSGHKPFLFFFGVTLITDSTVRYSLSIWKHDLLCDLPIAHELGDWFQWICISL